MSEPKVNSWWIGLGRDAFAKEVATRVEFWRSQQPKGILDSIGERMRQSWEPPRQTYIRKPL